MHAHEPKVNRRDFLAAAGCAVTAAWGGGSILASHSAEAPTLPDGRQSSPLRAKKSIPIGVFDPVYQKLSLDEMLEKVSALGLEAMEIGTGGYPGSHHCPVAELLADSGKAKAWKKKFEDRNIGCSVQLPWESDPSRCEACCE
jgi:hypothetical protein